MIFMYKDNKKTLYTKRGNPILKENFLFICYFLKEEENVVPIPNLYLLTSFMSDEWCEKGEYDSNVEMKKF